MALQFSTAVRNARGDALETAIGTSPKLNLYTGAEPSNCAASEAGTLLASIQLPSDWLTTAAAGVKNLNGTWSGTASAAGTVAHFRIVDSTGATCHIQGTVTQTGGGGDGTMDNPVLAVSQAVNESIFTLTEPNA